ncbi:A disintegrin and metalloproteinase with thrombospondin motifs adt-2-like [Copidosoma floridanum]|uniref:A disintegrin and metalloproteinase with thrombospondin motifs adt-2-like n=1 Tax=Copidosoma floridanum TaxID=29053 RepID=UPI000C6FB540|nr:A disintegrin and metalloproteinase with thrombospondin motifs adt-2-like [Copidosoma floridanum]
MKCAVLTLLLLFYGFVRCTEEDTQVVLLEWNHDSRVPLTFTAFGKKIELVLSRNDNLLSPGFEIWKREAGDALKRLDEPPTSSSTCHYIHEDELTSAAITFCNGSVHGFVFLESDSLEITPLAYSWDSRRKARSALPATGKPHVVRRRRIPRFELVDKRNAEESPPPLANDTTAPLTIELAVFFDAAAYRSFKPYFDKGADEPSASESRMLDMLLAYVNNIQALYYHPSLGERVRIVLVRLELMERQPERLANLDGERSRLLDEFCAYSASINPPEDADPRHWDVGLYVSGLDFYAIEEDGQNNPVTMGLAPVGGVCWNEYACVIAEFGVTNRLGKPYPSGGFTSVYIAAHEIAHNLGMHHDSAGNGCPKDGYIMSPSRGLKGETQWSACSQKVVSELATSKPCLLDQPAAELLDHSGRYLEVPGRRWTAKRQCEILLKNPDAYADTGDPASNSCQALKCKSPDRTGYYLAGPGLDGTPCGDGKECRAGDCLAIDDRWETPPRLVSGGGNGSSGWSEWREEGECRSGCLRGSLGRLERRRVCQGEDPCPGVGVDVVLCKDSKVCRKRLEVDEYAGERCHEFARQLVEIDGNAPGLQAKHEADRPWVACAVFCKRKDAASYYTPKLELSDIGLDPYLPDGTWCHRDPNHGDNYFCRSHQCLPENFRFGKELQPDDNAGPMNAAPLGWRPSAELVSYLSLDGSGKPLLTRLLPDARLLPTDGDPWLDSHDYVELDELAVRRSRIRTPAST